MPVESVDADFLGLLNDMMHIKDIRLLSSAWAHHHGHHLSPFTSIILPVNHVSHGTQSIPSSLSFHVPFTLPRHLLRPTTPSTVVQILSTRNATMRNCQPLSIYSAIRIIYPAAHVKKPHARNFAHSRYLSIYLIYVIHNGAVLVVGTHLASPYQPVHIPAPVRVYDFVPFYLYPPTHTHTPTPTVRETETRHAHFKNSPSRCRCRRWTPSKVPVRGGVHFSRTCIYLAIRPLPRPRNTRPVRSPITGAGEYNIRTGAHTVAPATRFHNLISAPLRLRCFFVLFCVGPGLTVRVRSMTRYEQEGEGG